MTEKERIMQELIEELQKEEQLTGKKLIYFNPMPVRPIEASYLFDLMTIFTRLDFEHQERACGALNTILEDQLTEYAAATKAI